MAIVTPGIRPAGSPAGDQKRVATPAAAIRPGADYLVVGRPITARADPQAAAAAIVAEIEGAARRAGARHDQGLLGRRASMSPTRRATSAYLAENGEALPEVRRTLPGARRNLRESRRAGRGRATS